MGASERIVETATSWPGVEAADGERGELSLRVGRREIGHLHGDRAAHFAFPRAVRARLIEEGRVGAHPVASPGLAARRIEGDDDVRAVIDLLRLNYDRIAARHGVPPVAIEPLLPGLDVSAPERLPFAPSIEARAFVLRRPAGDAIVYSVRGLDSRAPALRGVVRQYLSHWHEAMLAAPRVEAPLVVHEADRAAASKTAAVRGGFSRRHAIDGDLEAIPIPGHTAGSTAYLWRGPEHRFLFPGDTLWLDGGEWVAAVLGSSDRDAYLASLELIRELEFDVLVPWPARHGGPFHAVTSPADARRRIDAILARTRRGGGGR